MKAGHVFTIEPMICEGEQPGRQQPMTESMNLSGCFITYLLCDFTGGWQDETWPDGWTAVTKDGKRSAQFEHTLLVTETGCEILTRRLEDNGHAHFLSQM